MPTLRNMIDGRTLIAASPAAQSVSKKVVDPFGEVKDGVDELNDAQLKYEQAKSKAAMSWMPVKKVSDALDQQHGLGLNSPDANQGYQDPNQPIDPMTGMPMPPQPQAMPGQSPFGQANLANKMQPPGAPGQPSPAGKMPGSAPPPGMPGNPAGPAQSAVPGKMGVPQPGQGNVGQVAGNPSGQPGMPGSPKVNPASGTGITKKPGTGASKSKGGDSGKKGSVKVEVHAERNASPANTNLATAMATSALRSCNLKSGGESHGGGIAEKPKFQAGVLKMKDRKKLKDSSFALPGKGEGAGGKGSGSYPIPDEGHARSALRLRHNASPAQQAVIVRKVHQKFPNIGKGV